MLAKGPVSCDSYLHDDLQYLLKSGLKLVLFPSHENTCSVSS